MYHLDIITTYKNKPIGNVWLSIVHEEQGLIGQGQMDETGKAVFSYEYEIDNGELLFVGYLELPNIILCGHKSFLNKESISIVLEEYDLNGKRKEKT